MKYRAQAASLSSALPFAAISNRLGTLTCVALAVGALAFSAVSPNSLSGIRMSVLDITAPIIQVVARPVQNAAMFIRDVTGLAALQAENSALQQENLRLREWYQAAQLYQSENEELRTLLNMRIDSAKTYITARVLIDSGNRFARSLLVSAGTDDGVQKGQAVSAGSGAIGRIIESSKNVARVLLLTDINSRVPVMIEGTGTHAILAGQNDAMPLIEHLPHDYKPEHGSRIITSGTGGMYPQGLPVGAVTLGDNGKPFVMLYADSAQLLYVRIIENQADTILQGL